MSGRGLFDAPPWSRVRTPPQGPSLRSGLFCPDPSTLIGPIRPTRRHIAISPSVRLIRDAFAVRVRLGDPRVVPSFHCPFLPGMPPSMSPGRSESYFSSFRFRHGPSPGSDRLGSSNYPAIRFKQGTYFGTYWFTICYGLSGCSPPLTDLTGFYPGHEGFYIQAFSESVTFLAAGHHYDSLWTLLSVGLSPTGTSASFAAPDPTVQISTQRVPQARLPAQFQDRVIQGSNKGWRRRNSVYFSHVSPFPRVRRLSHFRQMLQTAR